MAIPGCGPEITVLCSSGRNSGPPIHSVIAGSSLAMTASRELLQLDLGAGLLKLGLDLLGLVLGHAFLDRLGSRLDQVLGLLEAEPGDRAHFLDDLNFLV